MTLSRFGMPSVMTRTALAWHEKQTERLFAAFSSQPVAL